MIISNDTVTARPAVDAHLDDVTLNMLAFKPGKVREVAVAIGRAFAEAPGEAVWADAVALPELDGGSRNVIGAAWRWLTNRGIIQRLEGAADHRRSTAPGRRGGVCWRYRLLSPGLLRAFMRANGAAVAERRYEQPELI